MSCQCAEQSLLRGKDAIRKVEKELKLIKIDARGWVELYQCKECGKYWEGSYEHGEMQGGGILVLRKLPRSK